MYESVRVPFDPPRSVEERGKALLFRADGEEDVWIPTAVASMRCNSEGLVESVEIPQDVAERKGLQYSGGSQEGRFEQETMSRDDWFLLGFTVAYLIRGETRQEAVREAKWLVKVFKGE